MQHPRQVGPETDIPEGAGVEPGRQRSGANSHPTRRDVIAGAGAAAATVLLEPGSGHADGPVSPAASPTASPSAAPVAPSTLEYRTAIELTRAMAAGEISAREVMDAAIARIEALDPKINAVVVRDFDQARTAAIAADAALGRGERRPLLGLPMTVKEQYNIAGLPTTWGMPRFRDWHPKADALAVQRLKHAGAIIIGKTNVPLNLADWQSTNEIYGTTNNPWDPGRSPGGSSGGGAAALAAGFTSLELGSDIGGSLRAPAHYCGVFSHKPSLGLVPQRGGGPPGMDPIPTPNDMSVSGPMARSAADLALALDILAGPDGLWDGIGYKLALPDARHQTLTEFSVLVIDEHPLCPTSHDVRAALNGLADGLAKVGAKVMRRHPGMPDLARTARVYVELLTSGSAVDLPPEERLRRREVAQALSLEDLSLRAAAVRAYGMSHEAWVQTSRIRVGLRARWQALFGDVDAILCPPMPTAAFPHDHTMPRENRELRIDDKTVHYTDQIIWAAVATLVGLPATVAPIGQTPDGLPVGVQIIGGYLQDRTTIALAGLIEQAFGGFKPPPAFA